VTATMPATVSHPLQTVLTTAAAAAAILTLAGAIIVIAFGVIATSGVYGSRMAWLLGVALPLLAASMLLAWLAQRGPAGTRPGHQRGRQVFLVALSLFGVPIALALLGLVISAALFAQYELSRLF
jgi:hypothetical protein